MEQSQSFHRFSARWKNCCKRGNLSTKKPSLQTVEQVNGTGRWIALAALTHIASNVEPDGSTPRCFTSFTAEAVISSTSQNKKRTSYEMRCFFSDGGGRWIRRRAQPDVREHHSPQGEKRKATTNQKSTHGCESRRKAKRRINEKTQSKLLF